MPKRRYRPVRRRRLPGAWAWAGFAGGVTMGALTASLIIGGDEQSPPEKTTLAAEDLKDLMAQYLADEGYRPADDVAEALTPPDAAPGPAEVPAPPVAAPVAVPVPLAPGSARTSSDAEPSTVLPEPAEVSPVKAAPVAANTEAEPADLELAAVLRSHQETVTHQPVSKIQAPPEPEIGARTVAEISAEDVIVVRGGSSGG